MKNNEFVSEFIYGGMDGIITTIAIIGASLGAQLQPSYITILGIANLLADGFSMGISRYNSIVETSSLQNSSLYVSPLRSSFATFLSFVFIGILPLIPFILLSNSMFLVEYFVIFSVIAFFIVGHIKALSSPKSVSYGSYTGHVMQVVLTGILGAVISYTVATQVKKYV